MSVKAILPLLQTLNSNVPVLQHVTALLRLYPLQSRWRNWNADVLFYRHRVSLDSSFFCTTKFSPGRWRGYRALRIDIWLTYLYQAHCTSCAHQLVYST